MAEGTASQARHKSTPQSSRFWQAAGRRSVWLVYEQVSGEHSECSCCRLSVGRRDSRASLGSWSHGELIELEFQEHPSAARVDLDELGCVYRQDESREWAATQSPGKELASCRVFVSSLATAVPWLPWVGQAEKSRESAETLCSAEASWVRARPARGFPEMFPTAVVRVRESLSGLEYQQVSTASRIYPHRRLSLMPHCDC